MDYRKLFERMRRHPDCTLRSGCTDALLIRMEREMNVQFPKVFADFLRFADGAELPCGRIFHLERLADELFFFEDKDEEVRERLVFPIGDDYGGVPYLLDLKYAAGDDCPVILRDGLEHPIEQYDSIGAFLSTGLDSYIVQHEVVVDPETISETQNFSTPELGEAGARIRLTDEFSWNLEPGSSLVLTGERLLALRLSWVGDDGQRMPASYSSQGTTRTIEMPPFGGAKLRLNFSVLRRLEG